MLHDMLKDWESFPYKLVNSSILIIISPNNDLVHVNLIDVSYCEETEGGSMDEGYMTGI